MPDVMDRQECKVLLLFDDTSKKAVKTSVSVLGTYGIKFIDSLDSISDEAVAYSNKVVILEGYTTEPSFMSDLVLYLSIWHKKKESAGKRRTAFFVDMAQLYTDCKFWIIVLCIMPICQCRPEPLSHYQYKMDVDFSGNCASDEL